jgi:hypothetical protein
LKFDSLKTLVVMKKIIILTACCWMFSSCSIFRRHEKYGCPTNGKNIGAERILSGDKAAIKASKKAGKFKGGESY